MSSRDHSGCRTAPRGRNSANTGLMSRTGVPSTASRSPTSNRRPSRPTMRTIVAPRRLGRALPRCAKIPTRGHAGLSRGRREKKNDFSVREVLEAVEALGGQIVAQFDGCARTAPIIVGDLRASAAHDANRDERNHSTVTLVFTEFAMKHAVNVSPCRSHLTVARYSLNGSPLPRQLDDDRGRLRGGRSPAPTR